MKYFKHFALILVLLIGVGIPSCLPPCECPIIQGEFFDIQGGELGNWKGENHSFWVLEKGETVSVEEFRLIVQFEVDYFGQQLSPSKGIDFSLIPSAYACTCAENGLKGSEEILENLRVITKNNFDENHPANSSLNDLILIQMPGDEEVSLEEYLTRENRSPVYYQNFWLSLKQAPSLPSDFEVSVEMTLDNGEVYQMDSEMIVLE